MRQNLSLYCLLFILAFGFGVTVDFITGFTDIKNGFMEGWRDGAAGWDKADYYNFDDVYVTFRPKSFSSDNIIGSDSIYNHITAEKEAVNYNKMTVQVPKSKTHNLNLCTFSDVLHGMGALLFSIGIIGFWVVFFMAIRSIKKGDVFLLSVASYMTKAAIFLLVAYVSEWVFIWASYERARSMVEIANYEIVPNFEYNNTVMYVAFGLLLLSQIIKQGKELKEEQDLTI